jgi:magnesium-transporting ATPase (P-type)
VSLLVSRNCCALFLLSHIVSLSVLRDGSFQTISVAETVPGDVVDIKPGKVHCDMVVLKGFRILVDESALTGESTPVQKLEIDPSMSKETYHPLVHKSHTLSTGTEILDIDSNGRNLGLVLTTGSFTSKGELLTEVVSYQRHKFRFDDEAILILAILMLEAIVLVSLAFVFLHDSWVFSWFYGKTFLFYSIRMPVLNSRLPLTRFNRGSYLGNHHSSIVADCLCCFSRYICKSSSQKANLLHAP